MNTPTQRKKMTQRKFRQHLGLLLFSLILTACSQGSDPQQNVISGDKLSAPFPKAITASLQNGATLIVEVIVNEDISKPLRVENLIVDATSGTFSGDVSGLPTGLYTLSLVYSINDSVLGIVEVVKTSKINVDVVANQNTLADFSSADLVYTDTDGDTISNLAELEAGTDINIPNYFIGGTVTGLTGNGLVIQNNETDDLTITANGNFTFSTTLINDDAYSVTVFTQPDGPGQVCTVSNGSGTVSATISNVVVNCNSAPTAISVTITDNNGDSPLVGDTLTGAYLYTDADSDSEDASLSRYRWLRNGMAIGGATGLSYSVVAADSGQLITFEVTPAAIAGVRIGEAVASSVLTIGFNTASVLSLNFGIKQLQFTWSAVSGATYYKLMENPDGASGFTPLGMDITGTASNVDIAVHRQDWANARYVVQACDAYSCSASSNEVGTLGEILSATGYFKASIAEVEEQFGSSVALSRDGNTLAVGARTEDRTEGNVVGGTVYVFNRSSGSWIQRADVKASNAEGGDRFGHSVVLSRDGNTLAVGAYTEDSNGTAEGDNSASDAGAVYVFSRSGSNWIQQDYLKAPNTGGGDGFGFSVALSDDGSTLVAGVPWDDGSASGGPTDNSVDAAGAVYVFSRSGDNWGQPIYLKAFNAEADDRFGYSVALSDDGNTLAVGARGESSNGSGGPGDNSASEAGAVYVFSRSGGNWGQSIYLKASNAEAKDRFGFSVALSDDGSTLVAGAIKGDGPDNSANAAGAAYVFSRSGGSWTEQSYVNASNAETNDWFGHSVALSSDGNILAVGARNESSNGSGGPGDNSASGAGAVYVFSRSGGNWIEQSYVKAFNAGAEDGFGRSVALSSDGNTLAVGADEEDSNATGISTGIDAAGTNNDANGAGAVYLY